MQTIVLPYTDLSLSRLSFGTASLHHLLSSKERTALLTAAIDAGFTHIDTSPYYGFGIAEKALGLLSDEYKNKMTITSKIGLYSPPNASATTFAVVSRKILGKCIKSLNKPVVDWSLAAAKRSLKTSLDRIARDHLDMLLLHEPVANLIKTEEFLYWLERCQKDGIIRYWGVAGESENIQNMLTAHADLCTVIQTRDSLIKEQASWIKAQRPLQMTYGYLSDKPTDLSVKETIAQALSQNKTGSIIVSARNVQHITELAAIA